MSNRTSLYFSNPTLLERLTTLARKLRRSRNETIELILEDGIAALEARLEKQGALLCQP